MPVNRNFLAIGLALVVAVSLMGLTPPQKAEVAAHLQLALGVVAEAVNGWIAALSFSLIEPSIAGSFWRRGTLFGLMVWGFWIISGTFSAYVWLDIPLSLACVNVIFGLPKCLAIGVGVAWFFDRKLS